MLGVGSGARLGSVELVRGCSVVVSISVSMLELIVAVELLCGMAKVECEVKLLYRSGAQVKPT